MGTRTPQIAQKTVNLVPHRRKPQSIRTHMRADDRGYVDHQNIARHRLAGGLHELIEEFPGARFGACVQDRQFFERPAFQ